MESGRSKELSVFTPMNNLHDVHVSKVSIPQSFNAQEQHADGVPGI
jgi:hypothetical protein